MFDIKFFATSNSESGNTSENDIEPSIIAALNPQRKRDNKLIRKTSNNVTTKDSKKPQRDRFNVTDYEDEQHRGTKSLKIDPFKDHSDEKIKDWLAQIELLKQSNQPDKKEQITDLKKKINATVYTEDKVSGFAVSSSSSSQQPLW